jgi:pimeloyl-ACP methyl ester carboxylesterase
MNFYAQVVMSCIRAMKLDEVTLIGHSMGGQISVIVSLQMPSVVRRLVLVAAAGIETFTPEEKAKVAQGAAFFYGMKHEAQKILSYFHSQLSADQLSELAGEFITQQNERFQLFTETMVASVNGMLNEPVNGFLPQLQQRVLAIYGEQDVLIPNKWVHPNLKIQDIITEARAKITNVKTVLLPACGHYLQLEKTSVLVSELNLFCKA